MTTATGQTLHMNYDVLRRLSSVSSDLYTKSYTYGNVRGNSTNLVSQLQYTGLPTSLAFGYTYDALGNIATYTAPDGEVITYIYDEMGQLRRAAGDQNYNYTYTYDSAGNILTANGHTYDYRDADWKDLLTAFDGQEIDYDESGNPLSYYNGTRWNFTWKNGRNLVRASSENGTIFFEYDSDGLRTSKKVGSVTHNYFYASGQLLRETYEDIILDFSYDANGYPYALKCNGTTYYYITNLQGDVMYLVDGTGATVASYAYDPYGNIVSATGPMDEINPLRYRGYYYDAELEMYYLQSRYYDPMVGRFINADSYASTGQGLLGYNMFVYCNNNPVNYLDQTGELLQAAIDGMVHNQVLMNICSWNSELTWHNTYILYNGKNILGGFGYCDLYNKKTGEVWELKKDGKSPSVSTAYALRQLNKYLGGRLKSNKNLVLQKPYKTRIPSRSFEFTNGLEYYSVWYWYEGDGILRYNYVRKPTKEGLLLYAVVFVGIVALNFMGVPAYA